MVQFSCRGELNHEFSSPLQQAEDAASRAKSEADQACANLHAQAQALQRDLDAAKAECCAATQVTALCSCVMSAWTCKNMLIAWHCTGMSSGRRSCKMPRRRRQRKQSTMPRCASRPRRRLRRARSRPTC